MFFKYFVRHMGEIVDAVLLGLNYLQPPQTLKAYLQLAQALRPEHRQTSNGLRNKPEAGYVVAVAARFGVCPCLAPVPALDLDLKDRSDRIKAEVPRLGVPHRAVEVM